MSSQDAYKALGDAIDRLDVAVPCTNAPSLFFRDDDDLRPQLYTNYAKKMCSECPVINECLEYALEANEIHGIWGGTVAHERKALKRRRPLNTRRVA